MGLGGVAIATLPSVIFPKLMFSDRLGGEACMVLQKYVNLRHLNTKQSNICF